ncbi:MAG: hypothetical protein AAF682_03225 [Planctomycetota bacterium]
MTHVSRFVWLLALAPLLSVAFAQGQLWIVDASGGPDADFTDIQPAVDAAADGDTVQVREGSYGDVLVDARSLSVVAEAAASVGAGEVTVRNVAGSQSVVLRGFGVSGVDLTSNQGPVLLESIGGGFGPSLCSPFISGGAANILACDAVVLSGCTFTGNFADSVGDVGLRITSSTVHAYETRAAGSTPLAAGGSGGFGVTAFGSFLFASGGSFAGGCGADTGFPCSGTGGTGGAGLFASGSTVNLVSVELAGGKGGFGFGCGDGLDGQPVLGGFTAVAGNPRGYSISPFGDGGASATIDYAGVAGDLVFSLIALDVEPLYLAELAGSLALTIPPILVSHGVAGDGTLTVSVPLPSLPPGQEAFTVYAQGAAISPVGAAVLAAPSVLTIL